MKNLFRVLLLTALFSLSAKAQVVSTPIYLTNLPPQVQAEFEAVYLLHQAACTANTNSPSYLPQYTWKTNTVITVTATNAAGEPTNWSTNYVAEKVNDKLTRSQFMDKLMTYHRAKINVTEIFQETLGITRRKIGDAKIEKTGKE